MQQTTDAHAISALQRPQAPESPDLPGRFTANHNGLVHEVAQIYNRGTRAWYAAFFCLFLIATLGGIFDPTRGPDDPQLWPGAIFAATEAWFLVRATRLGFTVTESQLVYRGLLWTRHIDRAAIKKVDTTGYRLPQWQSRRYVMVRVSTIAGELDAFGLAGTARRVQAAVDRLAIALDLPESRPTPPRHAKP